MARDGIEVQLTAEMLQTKEAFAQMTSQLSQTTKALEKLESVVNKFGSNASKSIKQASDETKRLGNNASSSIKKLEGFNTISDAFRNTYNMARKTTQGLVTMFKTAIDYSEELNLFNVVFKNKMNDIDTQFSEVGLRAEKFQQQLHEAFGTNLLETRRYQALFQSMGENMGIVTEKAEIMSTNLTKLSYDIASLYNAEEDDVAQAIRAGVYAGQTKPLRRFGIDVTQVSMQPVMDELGLDKSISELSQAEKQIIRYMSVLKQASVTHGDFANTIESPANQLKILKQQCAEARIALGNLFVGAFAKMLPYANAILMVIKEIAKAIASFFGIKVEDFNSGIAVGVEEFEDLGDSVGGVGDSAGKASKAVKELKRQTLGFDQINNLTTPTPSSGSSGGGGGAGGSAIGGIDQRLLDALKGYENGMEKVRMKANEIRDKIMDWLGFTKEIDPITGEVSWKFNGIGATLKSIGKHLWEASGTTKVLFGLGIGVALLKVWDLLKKVNLVAGKSGLLSVVSALFGPTKKLFTLLGGNLVTAFSTKLPTSIGMTTEMWRQQMGIVDAVSGKVNGLVGYLNMAKTALLGVGIAIGGIAIYGDSIKSLHQDGANFANILGTIGGGLATVGGLMTAGASIGGAYGMAIGGAVGALIVLFQTMNELSDHYPKYTKQHEELKKEIDNLTESYHSEIEAIERGVATNMAQIDSDKKLAEELMSITDANGKVKAGYEDRASFIIGRLNDAYGLEISMTDGIIKNYDGIKKKIFDVIEAKKAQIYFNAYEKEYEASVIKSAEAEGKVKKAVEERNEAIKDLADKQARANELAERNKEIAKELSENNGMLTYNTKALNDELERNMKELEGNSQSQIQLNDKIKDFDEDVKNATKTYVEATNTQNKYGEIWKAQQAGNWAEVERLYKEGTDKTTKTFRDNLIKQAQAVESGGEIPTSIIEGFRILALNSEKEYNKALSKLPEDTAKQIDDSLKETSKKKKSAYGTYFEFGTEAKNGTNTATKGLSDEVVNQFTKKFTSKDSKEKFNKAGKTAGKETMSGIKSETDKGVKVKTTANTSGVTDSVRNAINNNGRGYSATAYVNFKTDGNQTFEIRKKALGGIFNNGLWQNIKQYASGGLPNHGTMFTAGERGPEVVGHIGSRTEVLNQSQLASVMYEAVTKAISNSNLGNGIEFYAHTDEGVIIDRINRRTRQTGQCPIEI